MTAINSSLIWEEADWPVKQQVRAGMTFRNNGFSNDQYKSLNLAMHVNDDAESVSKNRQFLVEQLNLPVMPVWLNQIHSDRWLNLDKRPDNIEGDASFTSMSNQICAVLTADCMPILVYDPIQKCVAAIHCGWKGISAGILNKLKYFFNDPSQLYIWIGPHISEAHYPVKKDVYDACQQASNLANEAFEQLDETHWLCDLAKLAELNLRETGINHIYRSTYCSYQHEEKFYSYRRDGVTGRTACMIWME